VIINRLMHLRTARTFETAHIMTGGQSVRPKITRAFQEIREFYPLVTTDAGYRCLAAGISLGEVLNHGLLEAFFVIENIMSHPEFIGDTLGIINVLARATCTFPLLNPRIELQRDAYDLVSLALKKRGSDRRIDAARHGDHDP